MSSGKRFAAILAGVTLVLLIVAIVGSYTRMKTRPASVGEAASMVRSECPVGSLRSRVLAVLDERGIEHSSNYLGQTATGTNTETAIIRDADRTLLHRTDIRIVFAFDDGGRLKSFVVDELTGGPTTDESARPRD